MGFYYQPDILPCARSGPVKAGARDVRCTNADASAYVRNREPFANSQKSLFGYWVSHGVYAVFSYRTDWPLFVWSDLEGVWFENPEKYSTTTSCHRTTAHPHQSTQPRSRDALVRFLDLVTHNSPETDDAA